MSETFYSRTGKRLFDASAAFVGLLVLSPLFLLVAVAVKVSSRGSVFFRQTRIGRFGKPFRIVKFRTMIAGSGEPASLITADGDSRITAIGRYLRKTKLDELPQLFNILLGDMSLVGPRPELPAYVASYTAEQRATLGVKPGATGPSINVYEEELLASRPDREQLYVTVVLPAKLTIAAAYCEDIRFFEDIRIIGWSIRIVLGRLLELFWMPSASRERALHGSQSLRDS